MTEPNKPATDTAVNSFVHTPGPWRQAHVVSAYEMKRRVIIASEESEYAGCPVCEVYGTTDEDCVANAKLVAASPELLKVCWETIQYLETRADTQSNALWGIASAAYRKALGIAE